MMKKFDLELAKAGHPVQTRDGKKARILCFDRKDDDCPIVALVEIDGYEYTKHYTLKGVANDIDSGMDLFMTPYKREVWINIHYDVDNPFYSGVFKSKEEAERFYQQHDSDIDKTKVKTIKVEWEE